jgi:hypothetical protein
MATPMANGVNRNIAALRSARVEFRRSLPLGPVELPVVALSGKDWGSCCIEAPSCPIVQGVTLTRICKRVNPSRSAAEFVLSPLAPSDDSATDATTLKSAALATLLEVDATVRHSAGATGTMLEWTRTGDVGKATIGPALRLPVAYEPSVIHGGVLVSISIPPSAIDGSCVVIERASVAGVEMAVDESQVRVTLGFNHVPAPSGPVFAAVRNDDVRALLSALEDGASTEEADAVGCVVATEAL